MNRKERIWLIRALHALNNVPLPQDGTATKTAHIGGAMQFSRDARRARDLFGTFWGALREGDPDHEIEAHVVALEQWFNERARSDWRSGTIV